MRLRWGACRSQCAFKQAHLCRSAHAASGRTWGPRCAGGPDKDTCEHQAECAEGGWAPTKWAWPAAAAAVWTAAVRATPRTLLSNINSWHAVCFQWRSFGADFLSMHARQGLAGPKDMLRSVHGLLYVCCLCRSGAARNVVMDGAVHCECFMHYTSALFGALAAIMS
jgi:hypothetical protein